MKKRTIILRYTIFAAISIAVNIGAQAIAIHIYNGRFGITSSILAGTAAGLICKYVLDKNYVFMHESKGATHEARTFLLYSIMGIATTVIFWITEFAFHAAFQTHTMRYVGAVIGLCIGYFVKYQLDRKLVFTKATNQ